VRYGARVLDTFERYEFDTTQMARQLETLPGSYDGPTKVMTAPYGVIGFGEGALAAELTREFIDDVSVAGGTQFILSGGMDFGAVEAAALISEASGATVFQMGSETGFQAEVSSDEVSISLGNDDSVTRVASSALATYHYALSLAHMTGNAAKAQAVDAALAALRDTCNATVPTEENPAKQLAWKLWTRTPLLIPSGGFALQPIVWQVALSRIGKSMSIPVPLNALEVVASGFEARHESGDELVALFLGGEDERLRVARELLETRIDEVIEVGTKEPDLFAANMALWYLSCWVGYYLSLMYSADPQDSSSLRGLRGE
jgi:hypothetical protein